MLRHAYRLNRLRSRYYIGGTVTNFNPQYLIIPRIDRSITTFRYQTHGSFLEHSFGANWFTAKNLQLEPGNVIRKRKSHFCANVILLPSIRITIIKSKIIPWYTLVYFIKEIEKFTERKVYENMSLSESKFIKLHFLLIS